MDENRGGYGCKDCLNRVKGCFFMGVRIPEDAVIDPKFGSWTSSFLTQRRDAPAAQRSGWVSARCTCDEVVRFPDE